MNTEALVIDGDGHILEPPDLWEKYIDPKYRERAMRIRVGDDGYEYLEIDGKRAKMTRPACSARSAGWARRSRRRESCARTRCAASAAGTRADAAPKPEDTYLKGAAFGTMDDEGAPRAARQGRDGEVDSLSDYRAVVGGRTFRRRTLRRVLPRLQSMDRGFLPRLRRAAGPDRASVARRSAEAARELERAVKDGCKGAFVARSRSRACRMGIRVTIACSRPRRISMCRWRFIRLSSRSASACIIATTISAGRRGITICSRRRAFNMHSATFFQFGVFDRFPKLQAGRAGIQAGWIGYFLDRADAIFTGTTLGATVRLKDKPSYYFKSQCYISADPDERTIAGMMQLVGENKFFWASDYPHPDHPGNYLEELRGMIAPMKESGRRGSLARTSRAHTNSYSQSHTTSRRRPSSRSLSGSRMRSSAAACRSDRCIPGNEACL